eukprot:COSAG06_NODE_42301_length_383_cov_0.669014_2_plen_24_part_01
MRSAPQAPPELDPLLLQVLPAQHP